MKINSVEERTYEIIETDEKVYPIYRRFSCSEWENLIANEWGLADWLPSPEELEDAYQEYVGRYELNLCLLIDTVFGQPESESR